MSTRNSLNIRNEPGCNAPDPSLRLRQRYIFGTSAVGQTDELTIVDPKSHWDKIYRTKRPNEVSWYRPHLEASLQLIEDAAPNRHAQIIDVGGGGSTLVDDLRTRGYHKLSILDISLTALEVAQARLGDCATTVRWLRGDVTTFAFTRHQYDVWHDRAVFHFLTKSKERSAYVRQVAHAVKPGGHVIVATFGPEGPTKCSGLDVVRYDPDALHDEFGPSFQLVKHLTELHLTPAGSIQQFTYCYCNVSLERSSRGPSTRA